MEFFLTIGMIIFMYVLCKLPEWKANNRVSPPGMRTDWGKVSDDRTLNGMSQRDIYKKQCQGGYDVPVTTINHKDVWEDFKRQHPWGKWND